jgi:Flp pilus assembly protein TadG
MSETIRRLLARLRRPRDKSGGRERGQSMLLIVFALIGIFAFVGLAFDLAWAFVEQIRVSQAADAAALAAGAELPLESAARNRALTYLQENGYDYTVSDTVRVIFDEAVITDTQIMGASEESAITTIWIDTAYGRANGEVNTTDHVRVRVQKRVFMTFMQFVGFRDIPVSGVAEAENLSRIDTVIVFDRSGSMEFQTICYGCWEQRDPYDAGNPDYFYPSGIYYPLPWSESSSVAPADHCAAACLEADYHDDDLPSSLSGDYEWNDCNYRDKSDSSLIYAVIEAEEYYRINTSPPASPGLTYWVLQRNGKNAYGRDDRGAYISHHPYYAGEGGGVDCKLADIQTYGWCNSGSGLPVNDAPQADYPFYAPIDGVDYYVWVRADGGQSGDTQYLYWAIDDGYAGAQQSAQYFNGNGAVYDGADGSWAQREGWYNYYEYRLLGQKNLSQGQHFLRIWASWAGFDLDRMIVTTDPADLPQEIEEDTARYPNNFRGGADPASAACCNACDPRFLGTYDGPKYWPLPDPYDQNHLPFCDNPDRLFPPEDITDYPSFFHDEEPIRTALEAAKQFVSWLDPEFDQVGYVSYSSVWGEPDAFVESPLQCLRSLPGACTSDVFTQTLLGPLDNTRAGGSTNAGIGLYYAWKLFESQEPNQCIPGATGHNLSDMACGRPGAGRVIIFMTDGYPNADEGAIGCHQYEAGWPGQEAFDALYDDPEITNGSVQAAQDCVVLQSDLAAQRGALIFTISIGAGADRDLMMFVADRHGSLENHQWAASPDDLLGIFERLYERVFLRLTL